MQYGLERRSNQVVLTVRGELEADGLRDLQRVVIPALVRHGASVLLDVSQVKGMSQTVLTLLQAMVAGAGGATAVRVQDTQEAPEVPVPLARTA